MPLPLLGLPHQAPPLLGLPRLAPPLLVPHPLKPPLPELAWVLRQVRRR